jgi:murein L,D-transpeptidase YafK
LQLNKRNPRTQQAKLALISELAPASGKPVMLAAGPLLNKEGAARKNALAAKSATPVLPTNPTANPKQVAEVPDFYGEGAYPLNYPNEWDKHQGKNGYGIWLHGTPLTTYSRPPRASDGCVVIANQDLKSLSHILSGGNTPVIIANNLEWLDANASIAAKATLEEAVESWRQDWQTQDTHKYLNHYSKTFFSPQADFSQWAKEKRYIHSKKAKLEISLSNISMFRYPDPNLHMAVVSFDQDYKSETLVSSIRKRQYWVLENQRWKIMYEGPA